MKNIKEMQTNFGPNQRLNNIEIDDEAGLLEDEKGYCIFKREVEWFLNDMKNDKTSGTEDSQ